MTTQTHVSFVLLAEFDIDLGAVLSRQFPTPLGTDEQLLAGLMLPDGAEKQSEDWTVFFLNQTPLNTVAPLFSDSPQRESFDDTSSTEKKLLYVLSLVRTKRDQTARRGGIVKAMAICTHLPFIHVFKPVLLIALEDYFQDPTMDCLERLYDTINAMDLSCLPQLSRSEKLILRSSDRKDVFIEKFSLHHSQLQRSKSGLIEGYRSKNQSERSITTSQSEEYVARARTTSTSTTSSASSGVNPISFGGGNRRSDVTVVKQLRPRAEESLRSGTLTGSTTLNDAASSDESQRLISPIKDTHYFETSISYKSFSLPIRIPLYTFPEEVGDYSAIQFIQTFSGPNATVTGPFHPHLHTNGALTHPIILIFNAIITCKGVLFLGHLKPAGLVSNYVLAACALASGCGGLLRGITERMFPYANLSSKEVVEAVPGFIAGVTNPIFEQACRWDVLCNIETGKITVNSQLAWPQAPVTFPSPPPRLGLTRSDTSYTDEDIGRVTQNGQQSSGGNRNDFVAKSDNADNVFMEDVMSAIALHYGEHVIRARFIDYTHRFVRLASRYEEEVSPGTTTIGYPSRVFADGYQGEFGQLGSGLNFWDEGAGIRELQLNANRIEGWRRTQSYKYYQEDFRAMMKHCPIQGFDVSHQVWRLRHGRTVSDKEVELIMRALVENVHTYEQVVELLSFFPTHHGGIMPIGLGLFHQQEPIRDLVVEILDAIRAYPVGYQFLQALNPFYRYCYVRLATARDRRMKKGIYLNQANAPWVASRTPSNRSDGSLMGVG